MRVLFLNAPSFEGFDGGAGSRYQARREIRSFWYPTWLAQVAAMVPNSKLIDAPPDGLTIEDVVKQARDFDMTVIHTSTPGLRNDVNVAERLKEENPNMLIGFVGPHTMVMPHETLNASTAIDFVTRGEFDYPVKEISEGKPLEQVAGISYRANGKILDNPIRPPIQNMDELPFVVNVYKRDLTVENYIIPYLQYPYMSLYTGRGCRFRCTFCLWPQTISGHVYRVRSPDHVVEEMALAKKMFPQVKEFFFDDDTFPDEPKRAEEIARKLKPLGITWSCNARAEVPYETLKVFKECGMRLMLVGFESGNQKILNRMRKGIRLERVRQFVKDCKKLGLLIHATFIIGMPGETPETIEETIRFAIEMDPYSIQVSLATPFPGTELYAQAKRNGWIEDYTLTSCSGYQAPVLHYPELSPEEMVEAIGRFYRRFFLRPKPILRFLKEMLQDRQTFFRRLHEGRIFFASLSQQEEEVKQLKRAKKMGQTKPAVV